MQYIVFGDNHNDADGRASGAIVRRALGKNVTLYEMDYGDSLPLDLVLVSDHILIVDFSLPKLEMEKLATSELTLLRLKNFPQSTIIRSV